MSEPPDWATLLESARRELGALVHDLGDAGHDVAEIVARRERLIDDVAAGHGALP